MVHVLDRLLDRHGRGAKAIVWEHNTHVGDARFTNMARAGMVNVGQLARERLGEEHVALVGFGGSAGTVLAAERWGATARRFPVPPPPPGTHEDVIGRALDEAALFVLPDDRSGHWLSTTRGHRAIGVVYDPRRDAHGNWVPTVLGRRYDAFLWFPSTEALHPLHAEPAAYGQELETAPWGT
jgi:erythromycin esterase-like protein